MLSVSLLVLSLLLPAPRGEEPEGWIRLPVSRDSWISAYPGEREGSNGGAALLKLKGIQEFFLLDCDVASLRGRVVEAAELHLRPVSDTPPRRLTLSSISASWKEGKGRGYARERGAATFAMAAQDERPWAFPGSDLTAVINGAGGSQWHFADPRPQGERLVYPLHPRLVALRIAGLSGGFFVMDDVGSEYTRRGEEFTYRLYLNRYVASREAGPPRAPFFRVRLGRRDCTPPPRVEALGPVPGQLPPGRARLGWRTPADAGGAGTVGFRAAWCRGERFDPARATPLPAWLVPAAGAPGHQVVMEVRDLGFRGGEEIALGVRALDGAGNAGPWATITLKLPLVPPYELPPASRPPSAPAAPLPTLAGMEVAVVDPLDKFDRSGKGSLPARPAAYLGANHIWSARDRTLRLAGGRNEFLACQFLFLGPGRPLQGKVAFPGLGREGPRAEFLSCRYLVTPAGTLPDPLLPAREGRIEPPPGKGRLFAALLDLYIPHHTPPGRHVGQVTLTAGKEELRLPLELRVHSFTLPDHLSFIPELNCYNLPRPPGEVAWYRLAHRHRTNLNRLPYGWRGRNLVCPPGRREKGFDFTAWDRRFGPLLDGSAFADLPRRGVPVTGFYLPLNEDWPLPVDEGFRGGYWADRAFTPAYREGFSRACRDFARHIRQKGWKDTLFQFYLNNKIYHKKDRWDRSSAPWVFDEPQNTQDFFALRWFGRLFHEAVLPAGEGIRPVFRCDISRPQWQRDLLDGLLDVNVVGAAFHRYRRRVLERRRRWGEITFLYGSPTPVDGPGTGPLAWCLHAWLAGVDGVIPWQSIGREVSWRDPDRLALIYPGPRADRKGPVPSLRLKAFRRGQQDTEYLTLLARVEGRPRWALARAVRERLDLRVRSLPARGEEAGRSRFQPEDPVVFADLRRVLGQRLDRAAPPPARRLVEFTPPLRRPDRLPTRLHPPGPTREEQ